MSESVVLFDEDPITGRVRTFHTLPDGRFALESRVDVEPVIDMNKALASVAPTNWKDNDNLVARIPNIILFQLYKTWREQGLGFWDRQKALHKFLNNSDYKDFRIMAGKL